MSGGRVAAALLVCQLSTSLVAAPAQERAGPAASLPASAAATTCNTTSSVSRAYRDLSDFRCDRAIAGFVPALIAAGRGSLAEPGDRKRLARYLILIGRAFEFDDNERAALDCYRLALRLEPDDLDASCFLAGILGRTGRIEEAEALYRVIEPQAEKSFTAAMAMAARARQLFDPGQAQHYLEKAAELAPSSAWAAEELAETFTYQGLAQQAAGMFESAAAKAPTAYNRELFAAKARLAAGDDRGAADRLRLAGAVLPDEPAWHTKLGFILLDQKRDKEALAEFARAAGCPRLSTHSALVLAQYLAFNGRRDEALRILERLERLRPWSSVLHTARGIIYRQGQDDERAEAEFKTAIARNPENPWSYVDLAQLYAARKRNDLAAAVLQEAVKRCPGFYQGWKELGGQLVALERFAPAAAAYRSALAAAPQPADKVRTDVRLSIATIHAGLGLSLFKTGDMKGATAEACVFNRLKRLTEASPYFSWVRLRPERLNFKQPPADSPIGSAVRHVALADMLYECEDYADCCAEYRRAIQFDPNNLEWHMCLLSALMSKGDFLEAVKEDLIVTNGIVGRAPRVVSDIKKKLESRGGRPLSQ